MSFSSTARSREIRSMASPGGRDDPWRESDARRIAVLDGVGFGAVWLITPSPLAGSETSRTRSRAWGGGNSKCRSRGTPLANSPRGGREQAAPGGILLNASFLLTRCLRARDSVRGGRRRPGRRLRGGLRGAADDHGEKALSPQAFGDPPGVLEGNGVDHRVALLDVVDRKPVELKLQHSRGEFGRGVQRQHLRA